MFHFVLDTDRFQSFRLEFELFAMFVLGANANVLGPPHLFVKSGYR